MDGISIFNIYAKEMLPTVGILDRLAKPLDIKYRKTILQLNQYSPDILLKMYTH